MLDLKTFRKIKKLQEEGFTASVIMMKVRTSKTQYFKWCLIDEETFIKHLQSRSTFKLDSYREYILSIIKVTPQINDTTILYRCIEEFEDFDVPRMTFLRFVKRVREESGFVKKERRIYKVGNETLPGLESQVDFGQYKMKDMYGNNKIVYFFCMVLSYSRMMFVYFSIDPFTTELAILAHDYAFKYFGGRTQSILYDQASIFLESENFGDFILTKKFEEYVKEMDFTVRFCHKQDPESKALVENVVWKVKHMFLIGRTYTGIDSLNGAALEWLDRFGNGDYNSVTKKIPKEMFKEEYKNLVRVKVVKRDNTCILTVRTMNQIHYKGNNYEVISDVNIEGMRVKVVEKDGFINIYKPIVNELICTHEIPIGQGRVLSAKKGHTDLEVYKLEIDRFLGKYEIVDIYFKNAIRQQNPMYHLQHYRRVARMTSFYTQEEIIDAMEHCIEVEKCSPYELSSFLVYKLGRERARVYLHDMELSHFTKRAKAIKEELEYGRHK